MAGTVSDLAMVRPWVRRAVSELEFADVSSELHVQASIGSASTSAGEPTAALLSAADRTMFAAKRIEIDYA